MTILYGNRIMKISILFIVSCVLLQANISTNTNWEVRSTGDDLNGGGFVFGATGTDFSQQDAPQFSFADLASANATTTCAVTSASHSFVSTDVGNLINISAGTNWTTGKYQVVSVAGGAATLDRACGSAAAVTAGTWREGGGLATIAAAVTNGTDNTTQMGLAGGSFAGVIWLKNGTYTLTAAVTSVNYGLALVGYNLTHGDYGTAPTITTANNGVQLLNFSRVAIIDNLNFTTTAVTPSFAINGNNFNSNAFVIRNCTFTGFSNAINNVNATMTIYNTEIKNSTSDGITTVGSGSTFIYGSFIHNNAGNGVGIGTQSAGAIINSIISNNGGAGVVTQTYSLCSGSTIANNTGDGWHASGGDMLVADCILYGNGGFGIDGLGTSVGVFPFNGGRNNAYGANTSGARNNGGFYPGLLFNSNAAQADVTLTVSPFTSATNFALNSTAGGGATASGAGFPGVFPGGTTTGTMNIGAVQSAGSSGSGSTSTGRMVMPGSISFQ